VASRGSPLQETPRLPAIAPRFALAEARGVVELS
jgi:hypothetical protein